jgi:hypothetical protein
MARIFRQLYIQNSYIRIFLQSLILSYTQNIKAPIEIRSLALLQWVKSFDVIRNNE